MDKEKELTGKDRKANTVWKYVGGGKKKDRNSASPGSGERRQQRVESIAATAGQVKAGVMEAEKPDPNKMGRKSSVKK